MAPALTVIRVLQGSSLPVQWGHGQSPCTSMFALHGLPNPNPSSGRDTPARTSIAAALRRLLQLRKLNHPALHIDHHGLTGAKLARQNFLRQRILDLLLNRTLQRPRAVDRVEPRLHGFPAALRR